MSRSGVEAMAAHTIGPVDLEAELTELGPELDQAVLRTLHGGRWVLGPEVERLERSFAELCHVTHAAGVGSGTDALVLGLLALGVERGDHVLTSPFTFFASAGAIAWIGAVPRFADVDPDTGLLDPEAAAAAVTERTTCLLPVHLYGQLCDVRRFADLALERDLRLLEDGAQAHGATRDGLACGELGDAGTFSFYPTKNLGAAGEGGLVVTRHAAVAERLRSLRDHGSRAKYEHAELGTNSRLHALQAAVLNVKLPHLERWNARRRANAERYDRALAGSELARPLRREPGTNHAYHQYTVRVPAELRPSLLARLAGRGIHVAVHYPHPVHLQEAAGPWGYGPGDFPHAEALGREVLCLPVHPFLSAEDVERVAGALLEELGRG